jgi:hypothetical protein
MREFLAPILSWQSALGSVSLFLIGIVPILPVNKPDFVPMSVITIAPALLGLRIGETIGLVSGGIIGASIAPILFIFALVYVARNGGPFPRGAVVLFLIVIFASFLFLMFGWTGTVKYTSLTRAVLISVQVAFPPLVLAVLWFLQFSITVSGTLALYWMH